MKGSSVSPERWETIAGTRLPGRAHGFEGLGDGADLVELDQRGVGDLAGDGVGDDGRVGAEVVVTDQLGGAPRRSVIAIQPSWSSSPRPSSIEVHRELAVMASYRSIMSPLDSGFTGDLVAAVGLAELGGRRVHRDRDAVGAGLVAGVGDGLHQEP